MRRALLLINPNSRIGDHGIEPTLDVLRAGGIDLVLPPEETSADPAQAIVALGRDCDMVIAGGGDGTMNAVIDAVLDVAKPLGILPLGTANDLARTLALPPRPEECAAVIVGGRTRPIDIGEVNGKHFFNVASLGMSGDVARALRAEIKAKWGILGYPISLWRVVMRRRVIRADIEVDGRAFKAKAIQISVGNGRFYGGGMTIAADADIDDGRLDLVLVAPQTFWQLLGRLPLFRWGRHDLNEAVHHLCGKMITLRTTRTQPINTDGEITTETPARFEILPKALQVFVP